MGPLLPLLLWLPFACAAPEPPAPSAPSAPLRSWAAPEKVDAEGLRAQLAAATGHVRFFNFWATWCGPCIAEMPALREFAHRHPDVEVVFVNVDFARLQETMLPRVLAEQRLGELSHLLLQSSNPDRDLRATVEGWRSEIPTTLVVDGAGQRREIHSVELSLAGLEAALARAMK